MPKQGFSDICPNEIAAQLKCSCKTGCSTSICSCVKNKLTCSIACKCGDACENHEQRKVVDEDVMDSFDSDTDTDSDSEAE